jgi:two-component system, cell cycle response regulator DivK
MTVESIVGTQTAGPLVLLVEDYDDSREMYAEFLEMSGFRVAQATDGLEAVRMAQELLPDVILMDFSLPGVDGREATRRIKADSRTARIPVVLLTGMPSHYAEVAESDAFVNKPCLPEDLLRELRRVLQARGT